MTAKQILTGAEIDQALDGPGADLLAYWRAHASATGLATKADMDPSDFPKALPGVQIVECVPPPDRFRYRLVGTREVAVRGFDPTGRPVAEGYFGSSEKVVLSNYQTVVDRAEPICIRDIFRKVNGVPVADVSLFLPLLDAAGALTVVMVYSFQEAVDADHPIWGGA
ncbi:MAG: PAS domain-containing protein [Alphaproteobacteria bacterium]|nr:PAS domain-containing protein [Alphaproteobacteria bacterium]